jgi:hypothetical protein
MLLDAGTRIQAELSLLALGAVLAVYGLLALSRRRVSES